MEEWNAKQAAESAAQEYDERRALEEEKLRAKRAQEQKQYDEKRAQEQKREKEVQQKAAEEKRAERERRERERSREKEQAQEAKEAKRLQDAQRVQEQRAQEAQQKAAEQAEAKLKAQEKKEKRKKEKEKEREEKEAAERIRVKELENKEREKQKAREAAREKQRQREEHKAKAEREKSKQREAALAKKIDEQERLRAAQQANKSSDGSGDAPRQANKSSDGGGDAPATLAMLHDILRQETENGERALSAKEQLMLIDNLRQQLASEANLEEGKSKSRSKKTPAAALPQPRAPPSPRARADAPSPLYSADSSIRTSNESGRASDLAAEQGDPVAAMAAQLSGGDGLQGWHSTQQWTEEEPFWAQPEATPAWALDDALEGSHHGADIDAFLASQPLPEMGAPPASGFFGAENNMFEEREAFFAAPGNSFFGNMGDADDDMMLELEPPVDQLAVELAQHDGLAPDGSFDMPYTAQRRDRSKFFPQAPIGKVGSAPTQPTQPGNQMGSGEFSLFG